MKKKIFTILFLISLLTGCGSHEHSYKIDTTKSNDTTHTYSCSCGETKTENHSWIKENGEVKWTIEVEPTTTSEGKKYEECSICNYKKYESIEKEEQGQYVVADYYNGYYTPLVSWKNADDLKTQLHKIISGGTYKALSYAGSTTNWETNQYADQDLYDHEYLDCLYTDEKILKTGTNTYWNREHCFCASLMTGSGTDDAVKFLGRATDFHNLWAGERKQNNARGNKNYGPETNESNYLPADNDRGIVARALMYMTVMYNETVVDTVNKVTMKPLTLKENTVSYTSGNDCEFAIGNSKTLVEWALSHDVSLQEYQHNQSVYSHVNSIDGYAQGNRNPFVDYPDLVDYCFGSKVNQAGKLSNLEPTYHKLEMYKEGVRYYAIKQAKRSYSAGEKFSLSDIQMVAVNYDLSETNYSGFTVSGINDGETKNVSEKTEYTVTIKTPINSIDYKISFAPKGVDEASYTYTFVSTDLADLTANQTKAIALGNYTWNVFASSVKTGKGDGRGVQFGTSSAAVATMIFESEGTFAADGKNKIKTIYINGSAASKCTYTVNIYIDGVLKGSQEMGYINTSTAYELKFEFATALTGKLKIEILNDQAKAFYISKLGIDVE